ncbi:MAG TPA: MarR family transcriptional regulator [Chthoniobacterales bacterium]
MAQGTETLGLLLVETARVWRTTLDHRLRPLGLSMAKWSTLAHLARGADGLTQSEVAARVGVEEPTMAGILERLEQDGWIKRKSHAEDRRCKTVHLQRRASTVLEQIFSTAQELREELLAEIPQRDLDTCFRVLSQVRDRASSLADARVQNGTERRNGKHSLKAQSLS